MLIDVVYSGCLFVKNKIITSGPYCLFLLVLVQYGFELALIFILLILYK